MKNVTAMTLAILMAAMVGSGPVNGDEILVGNSDSGRQAADLITVSTTWTADNTYNLQDQIYVMPGATLTIEAGTVVASTPTPNGSGSLAVAKGGKIYVLGTKEKPVIMTSKNDDFATWREAANEWGNLTIMGDALVSNTFVDGNSRTPSGLNVSPMEGLTAENDDDTTVLYGGDNDEDDSGSISYLSIRYGGRVVGLANELNGLSLGGIGRATDIHHVEIMNNVDDGIEIWGGTVNIKYASVWNIGDDSFDIDQGYRGKAQFILIVQGYSLDANQGSGVGDNGFETDGAEDSNAQPVTTTTVYNATFIGQPTDGDGATTWRDNARVQYRNCIFMDCGEKVVRFDDSDGDGSSGYSGDETGTKDSTTDGTLSWDGTWTTAYNNTNAATQGFDMGGVAYADLYKAQTSGNLAEISDSVLYNNTNYDEFDRVSGLPGANNVNNVKEPATMPIVSITRADPAEKGGKIMQRVTELDPRAAGDAVTSVATAPADGFFTPVQYRGAFSPDNNWLRGWTAADQYGMLAGPSPDGPAAEMALAFTTINFETEDGVVYTIEESTDGQNWTPVATVTGDGDPVNIEAELAGDFDGAKLYRAIVQ